MLIHKALTSSLYLGSESIPFAKPFNYLGISISVPYIMDHALLVEKMPQDQSI